MKTFLFQGDSITDAGRTQSKDAENNRSSGYAFLVESEIQFDYLNEFNFFNRGIGGNKITDIIARIKRDIINLKPDYMSILIGVNDAWHEISDECGVSAEKFEVYYDLAITQILEDLPNIKILILEPFVLKCHRIAERWEEYQREVGLRASVAKKIAEKHNLIFVSLQEKFDSASEKVSPAYWLPDGVHPSPAGHELIAREVIKAFKNVI